MKNYFQIQFQVEKEKILVLSNVETVHVEDFGPKQPMPTAANVPVRSGSLNVRFFRDVWWWINPEFRAIFKNVKIFEIGAKFSPLATKVICFISSAGTVQGICWQIPCWRKFSRQNLSTHYRTSTQLMSWNTEKSSGASYLWRSSQLRI